MATHKGQTQMKAIKEETDKQLQSNKNVKPVPPHNVDKTKTNTNNPKQNNAPKPVPIADNKIVQHQTRPPYLELQKSGSKIVREKFKSFLIRDQCARCKQLGVFVCEHNTPVRDTLKNRLAEEGTLYKSPRHSQS